MAAEIDTLGDEWAYEPRAYANEAGQYLPDFEIKRLPGHTWFIEVKPTERSAVAATERMEIIWDSEPGATLSVFFLVDDDWRCLTAYGAGSDARRWQSR